MNPADYWPESLKGYVDIGSGRLLFRKRMSFLAWVFYGGLSVLALVGLWVAIASGAERSSGIELFLIGAGLLSLLLALMVFDRVELTRLSDGWLIERSIGRWRFRKINVRDADIMSVFVATSRTWPDFADSYSLSIEFPLRPFSGAPAPVELLQGFQIPKLDLAVLAKLIEDEAKAARAHVLPSAAPRADNRS